jgi:hypothetical protein
MVRGPIIGGYDELEWKRPSGGPTPRNSGFQDDFDAERQKESDIAAARRKREEIEEKFDSAAVGTSPEKVETAMVLQHPVAIRRPFQFKK